MAGMGLHLADPIIDAIDEDGTDPFAASGSRASSVAAAYTDAFERILGAPAGSLTTAESRPIGAADAPRSESTP